MAEAILAVAIPTTETMTVEELEAARLEVIAKGGKYDDLSKLFMILTGAGFGVALLALLIISALEGGSVDSAVGVITLTAIAFIIVIFLIISLVMKQIYNKYYDPFNYKFKTQFLQAVIAERFEKFYEFKTAYGISQERAAETKLFMHTDYSHYSPSDYLHANFEGMDFEYSDVHLERYDTYKEVDDEGTHYVTTRVTAFKGSLIIGEFDHFCDTPLYLYNYREKIKSNVTTESDEFNRRFSAVCENPTDALRFLTPHMMENLLALKNFREDINVSFVDNMVCVAVEDGSNRFELPKSIKTPVTETRKNIDKDIDFIVKVLSHMNAGSPRRHIG
jgi:hypothetical protein